MEQDLRRRPPEVFFHIPAGLTSRFPIPDNPVMREVDTQEDKPPVDGSTIAIMKKTMTALVCLVCLSPLGAVSLSLGADAASLLSLAYGTLGVSGEIAVDIDEHFRTTLGVGYYSTLDYTDDVGLVNLALGADYIPFDRLGFYVGVSLADMFIPTGLDGDGRIRFSNHLRIGYVLRLPWTSLDFRLNLRDLVSASAVDAAYLADKIGQLGRVSFTCLVSFRYDFANTIQEE